MIVGGQTEARAQLLSTIMSRLPRALVFSYLSNILFSGFLQFEGNFVDGRNNSM